MRKGTLSISWGQYGGFYITRREKFCVRVCLGWVAITWLAMELDDLMDKAATNLEEGKTRDVS